MKSIVISIVSAIGALVAASSTAGCLVVFIDEPSMPKTMIER